MEKEKKHILIIPSWYKTPNAPLAGSFFEEQARIFHKRGHQVGVLFPNHELRFLGKTRTKAPKLTSFVDDGIPTFYSSTQSVIPKTNYPTWLDIQTCKNKAQSTYERYVQKYGTPDVIHAHSILWGGLIAKHVSKGKIPYFLTEHFSGWVLNENRVGNKSYCKIVEETIEQSSRSFAVSSFFREQLLARYNIGPDKLSVLPNVVNELFYAEKSSIKTSGAAPIVLSIIGNLTKNKNHSTLFKSIKLLLDKGHAIKLNVVGRGVMKSALEAYITKHQLEGKVNLLGAISRKEVVTVIKQSHIIVSSSEFESFGVNLIEAHAVGRPVVAIDSGGPRDIINDFNGILCKENSPEALANGIDQVISNYDKYNQEKISEECISKFGEDAIYRLLINEYNQATTPI